MVKEKSMKVGGKSVVARALRNLQRTRCREQERVVKMVFRRGCEERVYSQVASQLDGQNRRD